jgi:hypothetical protein
MIEEFDYAEFHEPDDWVPIDVRADAQTSDKEIVILALNKINSIKKGNKSNG